MTIKEAQSKVDQWINEYGVRYFSEMTNALLLSEEVGEFSRLIARKYGEQSFKNPEHASTVDQDIKSEMADILFVLICLANQMDIDLEEALVKTIEKKTARDQERHRQNDKLH